MANGGRNNEDGQSSASGGNNNPRKTVLLVDDNVSIRNVTRVYLDRAGGWRVREAPNGEVALNKLDNTIDVLLLDREMPKVSGPEVVEQLDGTTFRGSVVILSSTPPDKTLGEKDVSTYFTKPADFQAVVDELDRSLRD